MSLRLAIGAALTSCCLTVACSKSTVEPVSVSGTLFADGKAVPEGSVTLIPAAGGPPDTLVVKDGKFEGRVSPGKKKVELRAFKMGKDTKMGDAVIPAGPENYLPAKYSSMSTLTAEADSTGLNPSKFEAKSN
ncbi:hypothetical protein J0H58_01455 [bacterium]|nr:hypothetical protein [bacterium]